MSQNKPAPALQPSYETPKTPAEKEEEEDEKQELARKKGMAGHHQQELKYQDPYASDPSKVQRQIAKEESTTFHRENSFDKYMQRQKSSSMIDSSTAGSTSSPKIISGEKSWEKFSSSSKSPRAEDNDKHSASSTTVGKKSREETTTKEVSFKPTVTISLGGSPNANSSSSAPAETKLAEAKKMWAGITPSSSEPPPEGGEKAAKQLPPSVASRQLKDNEQSSTNPKESEKKSEKTNNTPLLLGANTSKYSPGSIREFMKWNSKEQSFPIDTLFAYLCDPICEVDVRHRKMDTGGGGFPLTSFPAACAMKTGNNRTSVLLITSLCKYWDPDYLRYHYGRSRSSVAANTSYFSADPFLIFFTVYVDEIIVDPTTSLATATTDGNGGGNERRRPTKDIRGVCLKNEYGDSQKKDTCLDDCILTGKFQHLPFGRAIALKVLRYFTSEPKQRMTHQGWTRRHWIRAVQALLLSPLNKEETDTYVKKAKFLMEAQNSNIASMLNHLSPEGIIDYFPVIIGASEIPDDRVKSGKEKLPIPFELTAEDFAEKDGDGWYPAQWFIFALLNEFDYIQNKVDEAKAGSEKFVQKFQEVNHTIERLVESCPAQCRRELLMLPVDRTERDVRSLLGHWAAFYQEEKKPAPDKNLGKTAAEPPTIIKHHYELKFFREYNPLSWSKEKDSKFEYKGHLRINFLDNPVYPMPHAQPRYFITPFEHADASSWIQKAMNGTPMDFQRWVNNTDFVISDVLDCDWVELQCETRIPSPQSTTTTTTSSAFTNVKETQIAHCFAQTHCFTLYFSPNNRKDNSMVAPLYKDLEFSMKSRIDVKLAIRKSYDPEVELAVIDPSLADFEGIERVNTLDGLADDGGMGVPLHSTQSFQAIDNSSFYKNESLTAVGSSSLFSPTFSDMNSNIIMYLSRANTKYSSWYGTVHSKGQLPVPPVYQQEFQRNALVDLKFQILNLFELGLVDKQDRHVKLEFHRFFPRRRKRFLHWLVQRKEMCPVFEKTLKSLDSKEKVVVLGTFDRHFRYPITYYLSSVAPEMQRTRRWYDVPKELELTSLFSVMGKDLCRALFFKQMMLPERKNHTYYFVSNRTVPEYFEWIIDAMDDRVMLGDYTLRALFYYTILTSGIKDSNKSAVRTALASLRRIGKIRIINEALVPGCVPLSVAVQSGDLDIIDILLSEPELDPTAQHGVVLWHAFRANQYEAASMIVDRYKQLDFAATACFSSAHPECQNCASGASVPYWPPSKEEVEFFEQHHLFAGGYNFCALRNAKTWFIQDNVECLETLGALMDSPSTSYVELIDTNFLEVCTQFPRINRVGELFATLAWACSSEAWGFRSDAISERKWGERKKLPPINVGGVTITFKLDQRTLKYPFHFLLNRVLTFFPAKMDYWTTTHNSKYGFGANRTESLSNYLNFGFVEVPLSRARLVIEASELDKGFIRQKDGTVELRMGRQQIEFKLEDPQGKYPTVTGMMSALGQVTINPSVFSTFIPPDAVYFGYLYPSYQVAHTPYHWKKKVGYRAVVETGAFIYFNSQAEMVKLWGLQPVRPTAYEGQEKGGSGERGGASPQAQKGSSEDFLKQSTRHSRPRGMTVAGSRDEILASPINIGSPSEAVDAADDSDEELDENELVRPLGYFGPFPLTRRDEQKLSHRWQAVSLEKNAIFADVGVNKFVWLCPGESTELHANVDIPRGGFAFKLDNDQCVCFTVHLSGQQCPQPSNEQEAHIDVACELARFLNERAAQQDIAKIHQDFHSHGDADELRRYVTNAFLSVPLPNEWKYFDRLSDWVIADLTPLRLSVHLHQTKLLQAILKSGNGGVNADLRRVQIDRKVHIDRGQREQLEKLKFEAYEDLWYDGYHDTKFLYQPDCAGEKRGHSSVLCDAIRLTFQPKLEYIYRPPGRSWLRGRMYLKKLDPLLSTFQLVDSEHLFTYEGIRLPVGSFEFSKGAMQGSLGCNMHKRSTYYAFIVPTDQSTILKNGGFVFLNINLEVEAVWAFIFSFEKCFQLAKNVSEDVPPLETYLNVIHLSGPFQISEAVSNPAFEDQMKYEGTACEKIRSKKIAWARCGFNQVYGSKGSNVMRVPAVPFGGFLVQNDYGVELYTIQEKAISWSPYTGKPTQQSVSVRREIVDLLVEASTRKQVVSQEDPRIWEYPIQMGGMRRQKITKYFDRFGIFLEYVVDVEDQEEEVRFSTERIIKKMSQRATASGLGLLLQYGYGYLLESCQLLEKAPFQFEDKGINAMMRVQPTNRVCLCWPKDLVRARGFRLLYKEDHGLSLLHWAALSRDIDLAKMLLQSYSWDLWDDEFYRANDFMTTGMLFLTPIHYAAYSGSAEMIQLIFNVGQSQGRLPFCDLNAPSYLLLPSHRKAEEEDHVHVTGARRHSNWYTHHMPGANEAEPTSSPSAPPDDRQENRLQIMHTTVFEPEPELPQSTTRTQPGGPKVTNAKPDANHYINYVVYPPRPLFIATEFCHYEAASQLVDFGADPMDPNQVSLSSCFSSAKLSTVKLDSHDVAISRVHVNQLYADSFQEERNETREGMVRLLEQFEETKSIKKKMFRHALANIFFETIIPLVLVAFGLMYIRFLFAEETLSQHSSTTYWSLTSIENLVLNELGFADITSTDGVVQWFGALPGAWNNLGQHAFLLGSIQIGVLYLKPMSCAFPTHVYFPQVENMTCYSLEPQMPPDAAHLNHSHRDVYLRGTQRSVKLDELHWTKLPGNSSNPRTLSVFKNMTTVLDESWQYAAMFCNFFVPSLSRVVHLRASFEYTPSGAVHPESSISVLRRDFFTQEHQDRSRYVVEAFFVILLFALVASLIIVAWLEFRLIRTSDQLSFPDVQKLALQFIVAERWRMFLLFLILLNFGFYGEFRSSAKKFTNQVNEALVNPDIYVDAHDVAEAIDIQRITIAILIMVAAFGVTNGIRYIPFGIGQPADAILRTITAPPVLVFFFLFFVVWMAIAVTMYTLYSPNLYAYRNFWPTVLESFAMMVAAEPDNFQQLHAANRLSSPVMMVLLVICIQLAFLNILIAVIGKVYEERLEVAARWWSASLREVIRRFSARHHARMTRDPLYLSEALLRDPRAEAEWPQLAIRVEKGMWETKKQTLKN